MAVPDFQTMMLPLLQFASDQQEHFMTDAIHYIASVLNVSDTDRNEMLPSGQQRRLDNRVGWARTHLTKAGLLETTKMSHFKITQKGLHVVNSKPSKVDMSFLDQFPEHLEFRKKNKNPIPTPAIADTTTQSPKEAIEFNYLRLQEELAQELLDTIKRNSPTFFERLVVDLLVAMGYGGSRADAGRAIGKSGDEGIDGIIREDRLGLDFIYIQAKKWENPVGRPEIQKFAGALMGKKAKRGVFMTTSGFTPEARSYVENIDSKIVLIGGEELAQLMIEHNVGITRDSVYEIKKIDQQYFEDA